MYIIPRAFLGPNAFHPIDSCRACFIENCIDLQYLPTQHPASHHPPWLCLRISWSAPSLPSMSPSPLVHFRVLDFRSVRSGKSWKLAWNTPISNLKQDQTEFGAHVIGYIGWIRKLHGLHETPCPLIWLRRKTWPRINPSSSVMMSFFMRSETSLSFQTLNVINMWSICDLIWY